MFLNARKKTGQTLHRQMIVLVPIAGWQPVLNLVLKQHSHVLFLSFRESHIHTMFNMQLIYVIIEYI